MVSRFMSDPGIEHWHALKWILRYLRGTTDYGIEFGTGKGDQKEAFIGFCDSDYAVSVDTRKSQSGYVFCLYGSVVSWKSSLQSVVALSTTEAEYIAMAEAVKESFWLKGILADFGVEQDSVEI
ncbi:secreted RxLR effector protein 161-like [Salvia splendens]|uniref:secreted RxLR effector protein 161-like n=1 Tax=Salvia splendens TaxID=180675 RepID=UPI001C28079C|nr:secreted RxLR effector protein 161-like [Salvia splendens]